MWCPEDHIPRGVGQTHIPGLTEESQSLYEAYKNTVHEQPFCRRNPGDWKQVNRHNERRKEEEMGIIIIIIV